MSSDLVAIVDEKDNVLSTKARDALSSGDIIRVSVLWIENNNGEVLIQQRAANKKNDPLKWGPAVAGTVEAHETYIENIIKEAEEELDLKGIKPIELGRKLYWEPGRKIGRMYMFYKATVNKPISQFTIKQDEVAQIKWVAKEYLLEDAKNNLHLYVPSVIFWKEMYY